MLNFCSTAQRSTKFTPAMASTQSLGKFGSDYAETNSDILRRCRTFEFRSSDICIATFPRSGTTLLQEIVWQIVKRETMEKDKGLACNSSDFPYLEYNYKWYDSNDPLGIDILEATPQEQMRFIKTHCPLSFIGHNLLSANSKVITVARNPKDCCVSYYHFIKAYQIFGPWEGDLNEFVEVFLHGRTFNGDYFEVVSEWWQQRHLPNLLFLKYEDLVKRPEQQVKRIAEFLEMPLTPEQLDRVLHNCKFETMAIKCELAGDSGHFLRKGVVGDWRQHLSEQQSARIDAETDRRLRPLGLEFEYE